MVIQVPRFSQSLLCLPRTMSFSELDCAKMSLRINPERNQKYTFVLYCLGVQASDYRKRVGQRECTLSWKVRNVQCWSRCERIWMIRRVGRFEFWSRDAPSYVSVYVGLFAKELYCKLRIHILCCLPMRASEHFIYPQQSY